MEANGISRTTVLAREVNLAKDNLIELEKVRKQREKRELDREFMEAEKEAQSRAKEDEQFAAWNAQEDTFHLNQVTIY